MATSTVGISVRVTEKVKQGLEKLKAAGKFKSLTDIVRPLIHELLAGRIVVAEGGAVEYRLPTATASSPPVEQPPVIVEAEPELANVPVPRELPCIPDDPVLGLDKTTAWIEYRYAAEHFPQFLFSFDAEKLPGETIVQWCERTRKRRAR